MHETVWKFVQDPTEPIQEMLDILKQHGAIDAELLKVVVVDGQTEVIVSITTDNEFDTRRLMALVMGSLEPDEKDVAAIGAAVASAGEWMLDELTPGSEAEYFADL